MKKYKSFGYYFLNKRLHPPTPKDYKVSIVLLIINKNNTANKNKYLFVQQGNQFWNLPKEGIDAKDILDDIFTTVARNIEEELGFKGIKVAETKPYFKQLAFLFDIDKQDYDNSRSTSERKLNNPTKGKIYQLAIMEYIGPDEIPVNFLENKSEVINYKWVSYQEGVSLMENNKSLTEKVFVTSSKSVDFNISLFEKIIDKYKLLAGKEI